MACVEALSVVFPVHTNLKSPLLNWQGAGIAVSKNLNAFVVEGKPLFL